MKGGNDVAKDGTYRGGARVGAGRKAKGVLEKYEAGNPGHGKLAVLDIPEALGIADLEGEDMPPVKEYMKAAQRGGEELQAEKIYKEVWAWLKKLGCETFVGSQMIEHYAMAQARYIQCQEAISSFGFLSKHPTTGAAIQSPYVAMATTFEKQATIAWNQIFQVVKENCTKDFSGSTPQDEMDRLLRSRNS